MNVKFKIKNAYGEEKWWTPGENIRYGEWSLGERKKNDSGRDFKQALRSANGCWLGTTNKEKRNDD